MLTLDAPRQRALQRQFDPLTTSYEIATASGSRTVVITTVRYGPEAGRDPPRMSIIVPTLDRLRGGLLDRLLDDLLDQTYSGFEVLLVVGDPRQGRAINRGVAQARGEFIVTMDDDTVIGTHRLLSNLERVLDDCPEVGMVGASTVLPPNASWFQRVACRQIPRRLFPITQTMVDSDMVQHPCLAMRRSLFLEVGGEDEELVRGLDPLLRYKVRKAGYRVVIAPHTFIAHPLPEGFMKVVRMYFRNGRGSAFAQRHYPERIYHLDDGFAGAAFRERVPFAERVLRYPARMMRSLLRGKWIRFSVEMAYLLGYTREYLGASAARR